MFVNIFIMEIKCAFIIIIIIIIIIIVSSSSVVRASD